MKEIDLTLPDLLQLIQTYITNKKEIELIKKAYSFAENKHLGQTRLDGSAFIKHPLNVAYIMAELRADYATIATALLHEIIDQGNSELTTIKTEFNAEIAKLVNSITKINRLNFSVASEWTINYYQKILVGLCEDVRVIFIKLGDRLHNMRTLWALPENIQKEKAKETMAILAPIAHHLGIYNIKSELEDLGLRFYKPNVYFDIVRTLNNTKLEREAAIKEMQHKITQILNSNNIKHEIKGRSKSIYSIYQKLQKGRQFSDIYDILGLRVFVHTEQNCYLALGLIHSKYKPLPKRFKDFIAMPKENMYQSLHTTIFGVDGHLFEIQIRTYEMDKIAEYGLASHWSYKDKSNQKLKSVMDQKLEMFRSLIELNNEERNPQEFVKNVESEIFNQNIYLFTPKGDVIELPVGSTPIDFAYRVHTEIGEKMVGAIVNDNIVPLDYKLQDGDIVKININKQAKGPSHEWLKIAKTAQAKTKIKSFFNRQDKDGIIKRGEELLLKELNKQNKTFNDLFTDENTELLLNELNLLSLNELYHGLGSNKYKAPNLIKIILKETKKDITLTLKNFKSTFKQASADKNDILVEGIDKIKVTLANCCRPIKGDQIIGYISKGKGITVHRLECHNITSLTEKIVNVTWNDKIIKKWPTSIIIETEPNQNFLFDLLAKTTNNNVNLQNINTINNPRLTKYDLLILVEDQEQLQKFITDVEQIPYVHKVVRIIK